MAKKKAVNKSAEIRKYLQRHPNAGPTETAEALKEYDVTPQFVSTIKTKMNGPPKKKKRRKKKRAAGKRRAAALQRRAPAQASAEHPVILAAQLLRACGSAEEAHAAIEATEAARRVFA